MEASAIESLSMDHPEKLSPQQLADIAKTIKSDVEDICCTFVDPFPKEVQTECSICLNTLKEPYMVGCCGNRFCKACIKGQEVIQACPLCNASPVQTLPDKQLQRRINEGLVYCPLKDSGCSWTGELSKLKEHLCFSETNAFVNTDSMKKCQYFPIKCSLCSQHLRRIDMEVHIEACEFRPSVCEHCGHKCLFKLLKPHYEECPHYPIPCLNVCTETLMKQKDLAAHLANECPLEEVECEYHYAGCKETMIRKNISDHNENCLKEHVSLLSVRCKELLSINGVLETETFLMNEEIKSFPVPAQIESGWNDDSDKQLLIVSNLPPGATENNLLYVFGQHGSVVHLEQHDAFAMVRFSNQEGYRRAQAVSNSCGIDLLKHKLHIEAVHVVFHQDLCPSCIHFI